MKAQLLQRFYDKVEDVYYEPSTDFVEFPEHVIDRLKELGESVTKFDKPKEDDKPTSVKAKTKAKPKN